MSVTFDLTVTLGTIIETVVLGGGGIAALVTLRNTVTSLNEKFAASKQESKDQFLGIQNELKKMGEILIGMARFDERLTSLDNRVTTHSRKIDDLSRGVGFVRSHRESIDGEYP
jgi:hypothetical protein